MRWHPTLTVLAICTLVACKPADGEEKKNRVLESNKLSDEEHFEDDEHNYDYDHEAFLGEDEARTFDSLSPEESRDRLSIIVDKIDSDHDGQVTENELKHWILYTQKRYINEDVKRQWQAHNPKNEDEIDWAAYKDMVYGFMDNMETDELEGDEGISYAEMLKRDQRRWGIADADKNNKLNIEEFTDFLHPEEAGHMKDIVVQETMEDIDKDKDGQISLEEYIGDMYRGEEDEPEPSWVATEREQFAKYRDKNSDGVMDKEEVTSWIIPQDFDHAGAEANHLIFEADMDKDNVLTKEEILDKYDLFVGSQATDFGEALARHDEF